MMRRVIFCLLVVLFVAGCNRKYVEKERELGYRGPARQDPFLAASRYLDALGKTTHKSALLRECVKKNGTLITPLQSFSNRGETETVMNWTRRGGHFVLILSGGENWRDDWQPFEWKDFWKLFKKDEQPEQARMLKELGIENLAEGFKAALKANSYEARTVKVGRQKLSAVLPGGITFKDKPEKGEITAGDKEQPAFVSYRLGAGRITLLAHAYPWRNRHIAESDHAALLSAVVGLGISDDVWFLNGVRISFWTMLWERAWFAILALALLLVVWLARNLRRLGPPALLKTDSTRDFSDHLLLTGAFLWRHREGDALVRPVQNAILAAARRRGWPDFTDEFYAEVASHSGLNAERVRAILFISAPNEPHAFRHLMHDLKKVLDSLGN
jgi:hypothetical protein